MKKIPELLSHQKKGIEKAKGKKYFGYLMEQGTGKSKTSLVDLLDSGIHHLLIIGTKGAYLDWVEQINLHVEDEKISEICVWDKKVKCIFENVGKIKVFIAYIEGLISPKLYAECEKFLKKENCFFILDEGSKIKRSSVKRTKLAIKLGGLAEKRRLLNGTPITRNAEDLYSQIKFLAQENSPFKSLVAFRTEYVETIQVNNGGRTYSIITGYRNLDKLMKEIEPFTFRVTKEECLNLPEKIFYQRFVDLTKEQINHYEELKKQAFISIGDKTVSAPLIITQMLKIHQMLCGHLKTDDGEVIEVPSNRISELLECIEENEEQTIIWACYRYDIELIKKSLEKVYGGNSVVTYYGGTEDRPEAIRQFVSGERRFFVSNPSVGGYGITLTNCSNVIYYSYNDNLEAHIQSHDRTHRIGQTRSVCYTYLVAKGTLEEKIVENYRKKRLLSSDILGDKWVEWFK